jgi:antitoxin Phd
MQSWPVQDAKARFSEFLDACLEKGPQLVTRRGAEAAVLVPMSQWRRMQASARPTLKDLLLSDEARTETLTPARRPARQRPGAPPGRRHAQCGGLR